MSEAQSTGARRDSEPDLDDPQTGAASRRRPRDRFILTQPPPPRPEPHHPTHDDEDPEPPPPSAAPDCDALLAKIDELIDDR